MRDKPRYYHHGRSPAGWISSTIAAIGFVIGTVAALSWPNWTLAIVAVAILAFAVIVGTAMRKLGYGQG